MKLIEQCLSGWFVPKAEHTFLKIYLDNYKERCASSEIGKEILQKQLDKEIEAKNVVFSYVKRIALETIFDQVDDEDLRTDRFYVLLLNSVKALSDRHKGDVSKIRKIGAIALNRKDFEECSDPVTTDDVDQIVKAIAELRSQQESSQEISQTYLRLCQNFRRMAERFRGLGELLLDGDTSFVDVETDEFYSRLESQVKYIQK